MEKRASLAPFSVGHAHAFERLSRRRDRALGKLRLLLYDPSCVIPKAERDFEMLLKRSFPFLPRQLVDGTILDADVYKFESLVKAAIGAVEKVAPLDRCSLTSVRAYSHIASLPMQRRIAKTIRELFFLHMLDRIMAQQTPQVRLAVSKPERSGILRVVGCHVHGQRARSFLDLDSVTALFEGSRLKPLFSNKRQRITVVEHETGWSMLSDTVAAIMFAPVFSREGLATRAGQDA